MRGQSSVATLSPFDGEHASYCLDLPVCDMPGLIEVGTKPEGDGLWGQSDLAGNVWEWALDSFVDPEMETYPRECIDCANTDQALLDRVLHGGSFTDMAMQLRAANRNSYPPMARHFNNGVRCARTP
jgi:formylglycine-generating enzyme required for sulfatase activity